MHFGNILDLFQIANIFFANIFIANIYFDVLTMPLMLLANSDFHCSGQLPGQLS